MHDIRRRYGGHGVIFLAPPWPTEKSEEDKGAPQMAPAMWGAIKKSLSCKPHPSDVHEPANKKQLGLSRCSRSIAGLRDAIHGGGKKDRRHCDRVDWQASSVNSPRSIGSSELLHPIAHEVVLGSNGGGGGKCELRITTTDAAARPSKHAELHSPLFLRCSTTPVRRSPGLLEEEGDGSCNLEGGSTTVSGGAGNGGRAGGHRSSCDAGAPCHRCGQRFANLEFLEAHHLAKHAVTELLEGDSARRIVEIICRAGWGKANDGGGRMERVLKVHNPQRTLAGFEEYREAVKARAGRLAKRHPRCLADGNELLRFYGTTISCTLGAKGTPGICTWARCSVCSIIRHGFPALGKGCPGVFTASTSRRALEYIDAGQARDDKPVRKALLVCRVIAGRVHRPVESFQGLSSQFGFDSVAGKVGQFSAIEELFLLNPQALLPCFVVICKA